MLKVCCRRLSGAPASLKVFCRRLVVLASSTILNTQARAHR